MKTGDYVRNKYGITQYREYIFNNNQKILCAPIITSEGGTFANVEDIIKSSPNIIDLIEVGDYVNGEKITRVIPEDVCGDEVLDYQHIFVEDKEIYKENIKSIVTKEQFSSMEYRIGK